MLKLQKIIFVRMGSENFGSFDRKFLDETVLTIKNVQIKFNFFCNFKLLGTDILSNVVFILHLNRMRQLDTVNGTLAVD